MKQSALNHSIQALILLVVSCFIACTAPLQSTNIPIPKPSSSDNQASFMDYPWTGTQKERIQYARERILNKESYSGSIQVRITPNLTSGTQLSTKTASFTVQSSPTGAMIFQETFAKGQQEFEALRSFHISNTTSRYTLHIQKQAAPQQNGKIEVNINGTDWIKEQDFTEQIQAIQKDKLLLNANNSLRVRLKGDAGVSFTLSISEGGEAGTILRSRGQLGLPGETQVTHIQQNDTNIFNPDDLSSLGALTPYQGERVDEQGNHIGSVQFNHEEKFEFQSGALILEFLDSQAGLSNFQQLYGAEVIEESEQRYLLKLDLTKAPIQQFPELLRAYNQSIPGNIQELTFGSLASLQTFAIFMDAFVHHPELLKGMELNGQMYLQQTTPPVCPPSPPLKDWEYIDINLGKSWWLVDTHVGSPLWNPFAPTSTSDNPYVSGAWDYSIGTGVTVAVIDKGFSTNHREIERRTRISADLGNNLGTNDPNNIPLKGGSIAPDHGHDAIMTGFAERNNELGTSGVAPNATVIAYANQSGLYWDIEKNIKEATKHADILSMSFGSPDNTVWTLGLFGGFTGQGMLDRITEAVNLGKVVVVSAGNDSNRYTDYIPAKHPLAITVGAVDVSTAIGTPSSRFTDSGVSGNMPYNNNSYWCARIPGVATASNPNPEKLFVANFSNFGPEYSLVWAPGNSIKVQKKDNHIYSDVKNYSGTSAAAPFVSGVVALMKSRNPSLSPSDIKTILTQQARTAQVTASAKMIAAGISNTFMIDAEKAVKLAGGTNAKQAETYFGYVVAGGVNTLNIDLRLNKWIQTPIDPNGGVHRKYIREQTISNEAMINLSAGAYVKVRGWSNTVAGHRHFDSEELEILDVESICNAPNCPLSSLPTWFNPEITNVTQIGSVGASNGFDLVFSGRNFLAQLQAGKETERFVLTVYPHGSTTPLTSVSSIHQNQIKEIANDGTKVTLHFNQNQIPAGFYDFKLTGVGQSTPLFTGNGGASAGFQITAADSGFGVQSIMQTVPPNAPAEVSIWLTQNSSRQEVHADQLMGMGLNAAHLENLQLSIDGVSLPIRDFAQQTANSGYVLFQVPAELQQGVKDLVIQLAGNSFSFEEAINLLSCEATPDEQQWFLRAFNVDDRATVYVNQNQLLTLPYLGDSGWVPINPYLQNGSNQVRFTMFNEAWGYSWGFQLRKDTQMVYENIYTSGDYNHPNQTVFDQSVNIEAELVSGSGACSWGRQPGLLGIVYPHQQLSLPSMKMKLFYELNYLEGDKWGDQFGIGQSDDFSIRFEGVLRLPSEAPSGNYELVLIHDDGVKLFLNNQVLIDAWGLHDHVEHRVPVPLVQGQSYPLKLEYYENTYEAELGLYWVRPDGVYEKVPANALWH